MKKCLIFILFLSFAASHAGAQYKINRTMYDYHNYAGRPGDPYNPVIAGVTSFIIPGLGQVVSGEPLRGLAFFGGIALCAVPFSIGTVRIYNSLVSDINGNKPRTEDILLMCAGALGVYAVDIWSVIDAVRVAKVNNLAFRDRKNRSLDFRLQPVITGTCPVRNGSLPVGMSFQIRF
jgi:hypothetical protein